MVSPASSGIGGGAFMLVRLASGGAEAYDSQEIAPEAASENMYANNPLSKSIGARIVAVPDERFKSSNICRHRTLQCFYI